MGHVNLNVDSLTGSKSDSKVLGIVFQHCDLVETVELMADKISLDNIDKA